MTTTAPPEKRRRLAKRMPSKFLQLPDDVLRHIIGGVTLAGRDNLSSIFAELRRPAYSGSADFLVCDARLAYLRVAPLRLACRRIARLVEANATLGVLFGAIATYSATNRAMLVNHYGGDWECAGVMEKCAPRGHLHHLCALPGATPAGLRAAAIALRMARSNPVRFAIAHEELGAALARDRDDSDSDGDNDGSDGDSDGDNDA